MFLKKIVLIFLWLILVSGCSHRIGDVTVLSTKNIYCDGVDLTKLGQHKGVEGEDVTFLGIGADIEDAFDKAVEQHDGNLMIDAVFYLEDRFLWYGYKVRGTVVKVPYDQAQKTDLDTPAGEISEQQRKVIGYRAKKDPVTGKPITYPVYEDEKK
jgi:hypothetical protein